MPRISYFDTMRAYAVVLGVFFHCSLGYLAHPVKEWPHQNSGQVFFDGIALILHMFRVPVFFFIAGFFAYQLWVKLRAGKFIQNRFKKILIPLVLSSLFFNFSNLLTNLYFHTIHSYHDLFIVFYNLGYNWFLEYLLIYYALFLTISYGLQFFPLQKINLTVRKILATKWNILLFAFIIAILLGCCDVNYLPTYLIIIPNIWLVLLYGMYFIIGVLFAVNQDLFKSYFQWNWPVFLFSCITLVSYVLLMKLTPHYDLTIIFYAVTCFMFFYCFVSACFRWGQKRNVFIRYLSDASYWSYLVQVPIIIKLQNIFGVLNNVFLQFSCTFLLSMIIIHFSYDLFFRTKRSMNPVAGVME